jgi:hypothetical protein
VPLGTDVAVERLEVPLLSVPVPEESLEAAELAVVRLEPTVVEVDSSAVAEVVEMVELVPSAAAAAAVVVVVVVAGGATTSPLATSSASTSCWTVAISDATAWAVPELPSRGRAFNCWSDCSILRSRAAEG